MSDANGKSAILGKIELAYEYNDVRGTHTFFVSNKITYECLIGMDWLVENKVILNPLNKEIAWEDKGSVRVNIYKPIMEEYKEIITTESIPGKSKLNVPEVGIKLIDPTMRPVYIRNYHMGPEAKKLTRKRGKEDAGNGCDRTYKRRFREMEFTNDASSKEG